MKLLQMKLHWQILVALILAILVGLVSTDVTVFGVELVELYSFIGSLFLNALKMLIVPLIVSSIIVGIAGIGSSGSVGRLGGKTLLFYLTTSLFAILIGLIIVNAISPGTVDVEAAKDIIEIDSDVS
ncbi:MAG: dicarboxylate/amino acid:cation symporter, partial [Gammaproteobacteria bacterium]|nr:dicarboxylate/amino acid:cation symporter [Gammaproteobacteria bacterium]